MTFEWDPAKNARNIEKHGISFEEAIEAFSDENRIINLDINHTSRAEKRYFVFGKTSKGIITVRFTPRKGFLRIFGAGLWRQGRKIYEKENNIH